MKVNIDVKWGGTLSDYYDLYLYVVLTYIYPIGVYKIIEIHDHLNLCEIYCPYFEGKFQLL